MEHVDVFFGRHVTMYTGDSSFNFISFRAMPIYSFIAPFQICSATAHEFF